MERQIKLMLTLAVLVFTAIGGYFVHMGLGKIQEGWHTYSWPVAQGRVLWSDVTYREGTAAPAHTGSPTGNTGSSGARGKSVSYFARINVRYQVDDVEYRTDRLSVAGNQFMFEFLARWATEDYVKDALVSVSYDPERPDQAVLEPGLTISTFGPLAAGIAIIVGIWFMFYAFLLRPGKWGAKSD
jgi:hypothetical protein